jgi:hypothetical protein
MCNVGLRYGAVDGAAEADGAALGGGAEASAEATGDVGLRADWELVGAAVDVAAGTLAAAVPSADGAPTAWVDAAQPPTMATSTSVDASLMPFVVSLPQRIEARSPPLTAAVRR